MIKTKILGTKNLKVKELVAFKGNPKTLSKKEFAKLSNSMKRLGLVSPFYIYKCDDKWKLLDGHQRLTYIKLMIEAKKISLEDEVPCIEIEAKSDKEARHILLTLSSQYAKVSEDDLFNFTDLEDISDSISIPGINLDFVDPGSDKEKEKKVKVEVVFEDSDTNEATELYIDLKKRGYNVLLK